MTWRLSISRVWTTCLSSSVLLNSPFSSSLLFLYFLWLHLRADWFELRFVSSIKRSLVIIRLLSTLCTQSAQLINHNYKLLMALNWDYNLRCVPLYLLNESTSNGQVVEEEEMRIIGRLREISWESPPVREWGRRRRRIGSSSHLFSAPHSLIHSHTRLILECTT